MIVLGIDPGKNGALSLLVDGAIDSFYPIPTKRNPLGTKPKMIIDEPALIDLIGSLEYDVVAIEKVLGRGGWGANSNFSFGYTVGLLMGALHCHGTVPTLYTPKQRQDSVIIKEDIVYEDPEAKRRKKDTKRTAINAANRIFNKQDHYRTYTEKQKKPKDGICDAVLVAYHHRKQFAL